MELITTLYLIVAVIGVLSNAAPAENADDVGGSLQSPHFAGDSSSTQDKPQPVVFRMLLHKDGKLVKTCMGTELHLTSTRILWVTAAECLDDKKYDNFRVEAMYYGTFVKNTYPLNKAKISYLIHPKYNNVTKVNNIAVIRQLRHFKDNTNEAPQLPKTNDQFVTKEVDICLEWKNVTKITDLQDKFELNSIHTKVIKPSWCKLWYPFSPNKEINVCASGWYGKGLLKNIIGSPLIDTGNPSAYNLIGIATVNRHWTRWFGLPIEFLSIEPYIEWLHTIFW